MTQLDCPAFTAAERDFIRREFCKHFGSFPALADGILLRIWRTGPTAGQPKSIRGKTPGGERFFDFPDAAGSDSTWIWLPGLRSMACRYLS
jgi:hypothetical protein